jgi:hypothetical protein
MFSEVACLRRHARWSRVGVLVTVGAVAVLGALAGAPQPSAASESAMPDALVVAPLAAAAAESATPGGSGGASCPSPNPPNTLALVAGTPQTAQIDAAFATGLQVALANSDSCPVTGAAGVQVTFSAPSSGASGLFSGSGSSTVTVGADATGAASAPTFTADGTAGSYAVTASSPYGTVSFSLTNTAAGVPARVTAVGLTSRLATVTRRYAQPLQVRVLDGAGNPVPGATVTFTLAPAPAPAPAACAASANASASASFAGGAGAQASATTGASGVATSPSLTANAAAGRFTATAAVSSGGGGGGSGAAVAGAAAMGAPVEASFALRNLAGEPSRVAAGVGSTQSTATGTPFPVRLAVTVTDAEKNPVPDARVTFAAPAGGPSARFTTRTDGTRRDRSRIWHRRTVKVETDACGVAVAPALTAGTEGGYIVEASAGHARPAAFALVNEELGQRP